MNTVGLSDSGLLNICKRMPCVTGRECEDMSIKPNHTNIRSESYPFATHLKSQHESKQLNLCELMQQQGHLVIFVCQDAQLLDVPILLRRQCIANLLWQLPAWMAAHCSTS